MSRPLRIALIVFFGLALAATLFPVVEDQLMNEQRTLLLTQSRRFLLTAISTESNTRSDILFKPLLIEIGAALCLGGLVLVCCPCKKA